MIEGVGMADEVYNITQKLASIFPESFQIDLRREEKGNFYWLTD